jgi:hypothetical protein
MATWSLCTKFGTELTTSLASSGLTLRRCWVPLTLLTFSFASGGKLAWL